VGRVWVNAIGLCATPAEAHDPPSGLAGVSRPEEVEVRALRLTKLRESHRRERQAGTLDLLLSGYLQPIQIPPNSMSR
jgi:hypothetical protein